VYKAVFRYNDVNDAIVGVFHVVQVQAIEFTIAYHGFYLFFGDRVGNRLVAILCGYTVIQCRQDTVGIADLAIGHLQAFKGLRAGHFMH